MVWVAFADSYARKITNKVFHYSLNDGALLDLQRTYCVDILKDFSREVYRMPKALDKRHPGEEAHQHMANIIYNDILKESK